MGLTLFLDTNAIIALLKNERAIRSLIAKSDEILISVINAIEFRSYPHISANDILLFNSFTEQVEVIDFNYSNSELIDCIINIRQKYKLKLPDAIIAASAIVNQATLVTADEEFSKMRELKLEILSF